MLVTVGCWAFIVGASRMLDFSRKLNMLVLVGCWAFNVGASRMWTLTENNHDDASRMLGFQCRCQSDVGLQ